VVTFPWPIREKCLVLGCANDLHLKAIWFIVILISHSVSNGTGNMREIGDKSARHVNDAAPANCAVRMSKWS